MKIRNVFLIAAIAAAANLVAAPKLPNLENYTWYAGTNLTVEGKGFVDSVYPYSRLPHWAKDKVTKPVWDMSINATGMNVRFVPKGNKLCLRWKVNAVKPRDGFMSHSGVAGLDVYRFEEGKWKFVACARYYNYGEDSGRPGEFEMRWKSGAPCMVYLPIRARVDLFEVGVEKGATIEPMPKHGVERRVVHYGTSIVHGGCVSRPGMAFTNREGRLADVEVVNLGFSGAGKMEMGMCDVVSSIEAGLYILDCDWNMSVEMQKERYEPFVRELRRRRPGVPILFAGGCTQREKPRDQEVFAKSVYDKLVAEGWKDIHFLSGVDQLPKDGEATFDHCHPNDYGSMQMGTVFAEAIKKILK